ncbi:MAG TPA: cupredoxin domain-containing protein, partial [Chloroflexota bacterium]|nr:cupredoxin domain-containing protein [Chloroflexota bacterium]
FEPSSVRLESGKLVRITFVNEGKNVHEPEIKDLTPEKKVAAGQKVSFDVTPKSGTLKLYCEIHESQKMEGTVTVSG